MENQKTDGSKSLQIILLTIFSIILLTVLSKPFRNFKSTEKLPDITSITPQKIIQFGGYPSEIVAGLYIREIGQFDITTNTLDSDLTVWFRFDPQSISLSKIGEFTIDNAEIKYKSEAKTRPDGKYLIAVYDIKALFTLKLDFKNFPFDDHIINLSITHFYLSPYEAIFESSKSNFVIDENIDLTGWKIIDKIVQFGFTEDTLNPKNRASSRFHPKIMFSIFLHRVGTRHYVTILIPLILIFFIGMFTLSFEASDMTIGTAVASVSAIIAQRFVIEDMSPKSSGLMISDKLFTLFLTIACILFFISVFSSKISSKYKNIISITLYIIALFTTIYIISPFS